MSQVRDQAAAARTAFRTLRTSSGEQRNGFLLALAAELESQRQATLAANAIDIARGIDDGLATAMVDRLTLTPVRLQAIARDVLAVAAMADPLSERFDAFERSDGLRLHKRRVPLGVLGVIFESRPNVAIDIAALAIKSGNAAVMRGGKEAQHSNRAFASVIRSALAVSGLPVAAVGLIDSTDRDDTLALLRCDESVDLIIPRGGAGLHAYCRRESRIPVITGGIGICHLYIAADADLEAGLKVIQNAKVQRPTVCNALDTVLVQREVAARWVPAIIGRLMQDGVRFRCDPDALPWADVGGADVQPAGSEDFDTEWLSLTLGIAVVDSPQAAIAHIEAHSTGHSDGILTADPELAEAFLAQVDSAAVYWNASTRFTDGGEMGLGAEVAVSTQRLHARGPMGLRELTSYKWVVEGAYHVRA